MIAHILLIAFVIIIIELLILSGFLKKFNYFSFLTKEIIKIISLKKKSDTWKEKMLLNYSKLLALNSLKILGIFFLVILIYFLFDRLNVYFSNHFFSIYGIFEVTLFAIVYLLLRKFIYEKL